MVAPTDWRPELSLVSIGLEDCFEFPVDLLERVYQGWLEMLRQCAAIATDHDLGSLAVGESVLVRAGAAKRVVYIHKVDQMRRAGNLVSAEAERVTTSIPVLVMT